MLPQSFANPKEITNELLSPCGGAAMRRLQAITWIMTVCSDLRLSQTKSRAHLVAATLGVGRFSLAALGRHLTGNATAEHKI
jgi:hypothetical protein